VFRDNVRSTSRVMFAKSFLFTLLTQINTVKFEKKPQTIFSSVPHLLSFSHVFSSTDGVLTISFKGLVCPYFNRVKMHQHTLTMKSGKVFHI